MVESYRRSLRPASILQCRYLLRVERGLNRSDRSWKQCGWGIAGACTQQLDLGHALDPCGRDLLGPDPDAQLTMGRGLAVQHPTGRRVHSQHMVEQATKADAHGNELSGGTGIVRPWPRRPDREG